MHTPSTHILDPSFILLHSQSRQRKAPAPPFSLPPISPRPIISRGTLQHADRDTGQISARRWGKDPIRDEFLAEIQAAPRS